MRLSISFGVLMALPKARLWLPAILLVASALLLRDLPLTSEASVAFPEWWQARASAWWSNFLSSAVAPRPGGWTLPRSLMEPSRHSHDLKGVAAPLSLSFELIFPHLGNGRVEGSDESLRTVLTAVNFSNQPANCRLSFFDDDGLPLAVPLDGSAVTDVEFELAMGQRREFQTSGEGAVTAGWALLQSDQPVSGQAVFGLRDSTGAPVTEVGVPAADRGVDFTLLADSLGETLTGIALANPGPDPIRITAELMDAEGALVASEETDLEAHGHLAVFLSQLFETVEGIEEFLGSVRLRSPSNFSALTLRSTGGLLTSLPTVAPPPEGSERTRLAFPHAADGVLAPLSITTALALFNNTDLPANVALEFFRSDGGRMPVEIGGVTASSFDFELQARGVLKVETSGEGDLQSGWARVAMDRPLSGSAIFRVFRSAEAGAQVGLGSGAGRILETEVGVPSSLLYRDFRILADARAGLNTGLAVANVDPDGSQASASLSIDLRSAEGEFLSRTRLDVPAGGHRALFVDQLFPERDFEGFTGFLSVVTSVGPKVAVLALRSDGAVLTSTPTLPPKNGFAPLIEAAPFQNLAGSRPGFGWMLHQNQDDLSLRELTIRLAGMGLGEGPAPETGDQIGVGYFTELPESRIFSLVVTEAEADRIDFDTIMPDPEGAVRGGSGRVLETAEGIEIQWSLAQPQPYSRTLTDIDHHFFLFPGIVQAPDEARSVEVETELGSVSASPTEAKPVFRRNVQTLEFVETAAGAGRLEVVSPLFVQPDGPVWFTGDNLDDATTVTFPLQNGETAVAPLYLNGDGVLEAWAPHGVAEGIIFADNGDGPGNGYRIQTIFSPLVDLSFAAGAVGAGALTVMIRQPARQLALSHFSVEIASIGLDFEGLVRGQSVGAGTVREGPFAVVPLTLEVAASDANQAIIDVRQAGSKIAELAVVEDSEAIQPGLRFDYRPVEITQDTVILPEFSPFELELNLSGLELLPPPVSLVPARVELFSTPTMTGLAESALTVTEPTSLVLVEGRQ